MNVLFIKNIRKRLNKQFLDMALLIKIKNVTPKKKISVLFVC